MARRILPTLALISFGLLSAPPAPAEGCDSSCNSACSECCSAWLVRATCGNDVVAVGPGFERWIEASRVVGMLNTEAGRCSGEDCKSVKLECPAGGLAIWKAECAPPAAAASALQSELSEQLRLCKAQLLAAEFVTPQLRDLAGRPDLKVEAQRTAKQLLARLEALPDEIKKLEASLLAALERSGDGAASRKSLLEQAARTTDRAARDLSEALKLARDRRAIDAGYAERQRRAASERAAEERRREREQAEREAALLAKKRAEADKRLKQLDAEQRRATEQQQGLSQAGDQRAAARSAVLAGSRRADAAILSSIKFLSQRNLSKKGRSRTEEVRKKVEGMKRELDQTFRELQANEAATNAEKAKEAAARLRARAERLSKSIEEQQRVLEGIIRDPESVSQ